MSAIFCCVNPRPCSPTTGPEPTISLFESGNRQRKVKWIDLRRRYSRQDIEAFYQEGLRLQRAEVSYDFFNEITSESTPLGMEGEMSKNHADLLEGITRNSHRTEVYNCSHIPPPSSKNTTVSIPGTNSLSRAHELLLNTCLIKLDTQNPHDDLERLLTNMEPHNGELHIETDTHPHQLLLMVEKCDIPVDRLAFPRPRISGKDDVGPSKLIASCGKDNEKRGACTEVSDQYDLVNNVEFLNLGTEGADKAPTSEICLSPPAIESMADLWGQGNILYKIPKLLNPPNILQGIGFMPPGKSRVSPIYAVQSLVSPPNSTTISTLVGRDKTRVYLGSCSSYYTSNSSSLGSLIDLATEPLPPIPQCIVQEVLSPDYTKASLHLGLDALDTSLYGQNDGDISPTDFLGRGNLSDQHQEYTEYTDDKTHICRRDAFTEYSSYPSIRFCSRGGVSDYSPIVQDTEFLTRPPLTENGRAVCPVGGSKWETNNEKEVRCWKNIHSKSHGSGVTAGEIKYWLDEQCSINLMRELPVGEKKSRSMTFKKTFTKSMTKLRNRLSINFKLASSLNLVTIGSAKNIGQDNITPNSEQVMANSPFSPSLPNELRMDDCSKNYGEFQSAEAILVESTISRPPMEAVPRTCNINYTGPPNLSVDQHCYSTIYDDCVLLPFVNNTDESDDALSTTN